MKRVFLVPLLGLALAQVNLVDGPRPSSEVRGYLQGTAGQGYTVRVQFLVEAGANPTQGSFAAGLTWGGQFYACTATDCGYFRLSGFSPGTPYQKAAFDVYDAQNRLRGKAGVDTLTDAFGKPYQYQVQYALYPLSGVKTWMDSPDNPVPLEAGGWLTARPPGGAPERYRYPGMEGYQPPGGGSVLSGISPGDRDLAQKTLIDSMVKLRAFYDRQVSGGELWFFVPEVSPWTLTLAQEWTFRRGGAVRYVVPEGTAASYCPTSYRSDARFRVMPRESLSKEQSIAVIWPPRNASQKGAVMAGRYLVDRPDWREADYVNITTPLIPTASGLPEARATVWGYYSQGLQARVEFKEMQLTSGGYVKDIVLRGDPPYRFTADMGIGEETFTVQNLEKQRYAVPSYFTVVDSQGRYRGTFALTEILYENTGNYTVDYNQPINYSVYRNGYWVPIPPNGVSVGISGETFTTRNCQRTGFRGYRNGEDFFVWEKWSCELQDARGRLRGAATLETTREPTDPSGFIVSDISGYYYPLVPERRVVGFRGNASLLRWVAVWRPATDNDRPVEAGGYVTAEGKRYRVPGLEGYLLPTGKEIEAAEGDPYLTYITRQLLPDKNPYAPLGGQVPDKEAWYKPLSTWCQEKGL